MHVESVRSSIELHHGDSAGTTRRFVGGAAAATCRSQRLLILTVLATLVLASTAHAQAPVPLGTADGFAVLGASTVTNTGPTVVNGDLGVSPGSAVTGFPPGTVNGTIHQADAVAAQAQNDLTAAYNNAAGQPVTQTIGRELGGTTRAPGVYDSAAGDFQITGTLTLDAQGNPDAIFIFKTASTLVTASGSQVNLINGAQSCNVFWQVGSSATLGTNSGFLGNILALESITATTGATVDGRLLARTAAVTLDSNTVTSAQCATGPGPGPPADTEPPTIDVPNAPGNKCVVRDFRLQIRARDESGIKSVKVFLDGELIKKSTKGRFSVLIRAEKLDARRHTIRIVARDNAGNKATRKVAFRRCNIPVVPPFTG